MSALFIAPPPAELAGVVEALFVVDGISDDSIGLRLPKHAPELVVAMEGRYTVLEGPYDRGAVFDDAWITGLCTSPVTLRTEGRSRMVGVRFRPWGARVFVGMPQSRLRNRSIALTQLWGGDAVSTLRHTVSMETGPDAAVAALGRVLLDRLDPALRTPPPVVTACTRIIEARGRIFIRALAEAVEISEPALRSLFREHVGVSPKNFARLVAHDAALATLNDLPWGRLTAAAHNLGFADQSHFIRDFTALSGLTPGQYLSLRGEPGSRSPFSHFLRLSPA